MSTETSPDTDALLKGLPRDLLIGGKWVAAESGRRMPVVDPATELELTDVADASPADGAKAVAAASDAQVAWAHTPARERSEILYRAYMAMLDRQDELALIMTLEMGKPFAESRGEVAYAADYMRWFAEEAVRIEGEFSHRPDGQARTIVHKQPVGPALLITPWNFPLAMVARKLGPAIAAGCTSVLKPAPQTPLCSLAMAQLLMEAGLPAGVLNIVTTSQAAELVTPALSGGAIRKLSFTGSTAVGKHLMGQASECVVRTSLELGGNAAFIVMADADLDIAVDAAFQAKMRNMGEACTAANRIYAHEDVLDAFSRRLAHRMGSLTVGRGTEDGIQVGPMIDGTSRDKVLRLVNDATNKGARVLTGGGAPDAPGYFVTPTLLVDVPPTAEMLSTEIFGPVAAVLPFATVEEVVTMANETPWGLVAYVITSDVDNAFNVCERLEVGMVGLNTGVVSTPAAPFGGMKESGLGREGGHTGVEEFLEIKYISIPIRRN